MLKITDGRVCAHDKVMKNNRPVAVKPALTLTASRSQPLGIAGTPRTNNRTVVVKSSSVTSNLKKTTCPKSCSSSQESLTGSVNSVRKKGFTKPTAIVGNLRDAKTPIRMISNLQTDAKKTSFKGSNMRRAVSKDSVEFTGRDREKENLKIALKGSKNSNNCLTIVQMEREKKQMEQQISELVKNAESKKAEIATLRMEINRLKDLKSDDAVVQLKQELEGVQMENQALKERLVQLGVPLEMTTLSDAQKEQILIQRSLSSSFLLIGKEQHNSSDGHKSLETEVGEASGVADATHSSLPEWERGSSSSLSEMSVACLQDRIVQMEETHHSTNEELQATLQELADLQDQLADSQLDNERMDDEKAVLLESLCSQTEKLEECRTQITQLKQLLFQGHDQDSRPLTPTERECHLVDLLKQAQEAYNALLIKQEELAVALEAAKNDHGPQTDLILLRDRVKLLESTIESINADKRLLDSLLNDSQEQLSANQIEASQLKSQLENEQQKVLELQRECEASATSELNALLQETRRDKEVVEEKVLSLQEQLALSQREVSKFKDQLQQLQDENMVTKNNAHKQITDMEYRLQQLSTEKEQLSQGMAALDDTLQQFKMKCQHHLEDKRDLKATIGELQKTIHEQNSHISHSRKEIDEIKLKHLAEVDEWNKFQADLLTTVRVANDFKTEAQQDVERITEENKQLMEKNSGLLTELESIKSKCINNNSVKVSKVTLPLTNAEVSIMSSVEKDLNVASRLQLAASKSSQRGANHLSVRSLIESIENATKHKGQGPSSSCSSSSSSLNSLASDSRVAGSSILLSTGNDVLIKPVLRTVTDSLCHDSTVDGRYAKQIGSEIISNSTHLALDQTSLAKKTDMDNVKPLTVHPVSILTSKLDPIRRNSYSDISEKKDPLSTLIKGGGSKRNGLLKWCQNKTLEYKAIDITNFSSSWNDGLAFCALMHSYLPNLVPYDELDSKDKKKNFTLAFKAAESVGIPTTLNINDLISEERPDWQSIMGYVTTIFKHFET